MKTRRQSYTFRALPPAEIDCRFLGGDRAENRQSVSLGGSGGRDEFVMRLFVDILLVASSPIEGLSLVKLTVQTKAHGVSPGRDVVVDTQLPPATLERRESRHLRSSHLASLPE